MLVGTPRGDQRAVDSRGQQGGEGKSRGGTGVAGEEV